MAAVGHGGPTVDRRVVGALFGDAVNVRGTEVIDELKTAVKYVSVVAN